jgi:uncharacterized RDD family membrane protein YckC
MSRLLITTNLNIDVEFEISEFHKRLFAWAIDMAILLLYFFVANKILNHFFSDTSTSSNDDGWNWYGSFLLLMIPIAFYSLVTEATMNGQTFGKKLMHIKVINEEGGNATFSQYLIRWMLKISDVIMVILLKYASVWGPFVFIFLGGMALLFITDIFLVALGKKAQRMGDMAAGTLLINTKTKNNLEDTVFVEIEDNYQPRYPDVMRLSDRDLNIIRNVFNTASKKDDYVMAARTADKVKAALQIQVNQDALEFLETLLKDYNFLSTR